jgi:hypothetical protein
MHASKHRPAVIAIVAITAAVVTGAAAAYWIALGNGSNASQVGTVAALTINPGTTNTPLYPGGTADVALSILNSNPGAIFVGSLLLDASQGTNGFAVDGSHSGCNLAALSYTTQNNGGAGWSATGSATTPIDLPGAVALSTAAVSACQGAQLTVYLKVGP